MKLITSEQRKQLLANGARLNTDPAFDPVPVVKLYALASPATWLLIALCPRNPDIAYGLCDLGCDCPEIGGVSIAELAALKFGPAPRVERDKYFKATAPLSVYAAKARTAGRIVD